MRTLIVWSRLVRLLAAVGLAVASGAAAQAADQRAPVTYGALPIGASSTAESSAIGAEICRDLLLDPAQIGQRLPTGYRLLTAREVAPEDPGISRLLDDLRPAAGDSRLADYVVGSLCFLSVGNAIVDGVRVHGPGPTPQAFLWARSHGPRDPRMLGKVQWVQLVSWYSRDVLDRTRILASDPTAEFVDIQMDRSGPNRWSMQLTLPTERVTADVTGSGKRIPRNAPQPGFMSVALSGASADRFQVFTYFGHHQQESRGKWRVTGTGLFSSALALPGAETVLGTYMQDGWQARFGLYTFEAGKERREGAL
jgi:hypothetical protein